MGSIHETGAKGENKTVRYLHSLGWEILETNFRTRQGEIDIIAKDQGLLIFVEVKSYQDSAKRSVYQAVSETKQKRIITVAQTYLARNSELANQPCRFDVVLWAGGKLLNHLEGAFLA